MTARDVKVADHVEVDHERELPHDIDIVAVARMHADMHRTRDWGHTHRRGSLEPVWS